MISAGFFWMEGWSTEVTQQIAPDAAIGSWTNATGAVSTVQDSPGASNLYDTTYVEATTPTSPIAVFFSFPTPGGTLTTGANLQEFVIRVRRAS